MKKKENEISDQSIALVKEVQEEFRQRRDKQKQLALQWQLNMNFLIGNQYSEITPSGNVEDYGKHYFWEERQVYNHIAQVIESRLAKLNSVKMSMTVRPKSNDDNDINSAKLATKYLKAVTERVDFPSLLSEANMWCEIAGTAFYKVNWNKDCGTVLAVEESGKRIKEGDAEICVCSPFEIFPESLTTVNIEEQLSIIHAKAYNVKEIKNIWGVDVKPEKINVFTLDNVNTVGGFGYSGNVSQMTFDTKDNYQVVIERYQKPSAAHPEGRLTIVAGESLLFDGDMPYLNGESNSKIYPIIKQNSVKTVGSFFGIGMIERLIPVQRAYNSVKNRKQEFLNRIAMGVLAVEDGSLDTDSLEDEGLPPGRILIYRQGSQPPKFLSPSSIPHDFIYEEERLILEFTSISGVSDLMRYSQATGVTSGVALTVLREQDEGRLKISAVEIRTAIKNVAKQVVRLVKQYGTVGKLRRIAGENGILEQLAFTSNNINCDDVVFDVEEEIIDSPAFRKERVLELYRLGILNDEDGKLSDYNRAKVLELMGMGNWESMRDIENLHIKNAALENEQYKQGEFVEPRNIDDHKIHVIEHTRALLAEERKFTMQTKNKLEEHIRQHRLMQGFEQQLNNPAEGE